MKSRKRFLVFENLKKNYKMTIDLKKLISMKRVNVIGLMSGTSADGLDLSLCSLTKLRDGYKCEVLKSSCTSYPDRLQEMILNAASAKSIEKQALMALEHDLADFYAKKIKVFRRRANIGNIDLIGSHGQTIYHRDRRYQGDKLRRSETWQVVNGGLISAMTGIPVVSDFRINDIAMGGSGAPIMPICHYHMFARIKHTVAILNIGGITNLTLIPAGRNKAFIAASDCGPGNMLIDTLTRRIYDKKYDAGGKLALDGTVSKELLRYLKRAAWYRKQFPKSLGREQFGVNQVQAILKKAKTLRLKNEDIITTVSELTVDSVMKYLDNLTSLSELIICGGGAKNRYFMKRFKEILPECRVNSSAIHGIDPDYVEAAGFALLAFMFIKSDSATIPNVTGAVHETILGKLSMP